MTIDFYIDFNRLFIEISNTMHNSLIHVLFIAILLDIASGTLKSIKTKTVNSYRGLAGVSKHALMMVLAITLDIYLPLFSFGWASNFILIYFVLYYALSLVENTGALGFPWPPIVCKTLYRLNNKCQEGMESKINVFINEGKTEIKDKENPDDNR